MKKLTLSIALSAAFFGGMACQHVFVSPVRADTDAPKVVRAQSFALVDANGNTMGVFSVEKRPDLQHRTPGIQREGQAPSIALYDARGHVIWRAGETAQPIAAGE